MKLLMYLAVVAYFASRIIVALLSCKVEKVLLVFILDYFW